MCLGLPLGLFRLRFLGVWESVCHKMAWRHAAWENRRWPETQIWKNRAPRVSNSRMERLYCLSFESLWNYGASAVFFDNFLQFAKASRRVNLPVCLYLKYELFTSWFAGYPWTTRYWTSELLAFLFHLPNENVRREKLVRKILLKQSGTSWEADFGLDSFGLEVDLLKG